MRFARHALARFAICLSWITLASTLGYATNGDKASMMHDKALDICKLGVLARKAYFDAEAQRALALEATLSIGPEDAKDTEGADTLRELATALALVVRQHAATKASGGGAPKAEDLEKMARTIASLISTGTRVAAIEKHYAAVRAAGNTIYWNIKDFIYTWDAYNPVTTGQSNAGCIIESASRSKNLDKAQCGLDAQPVRGYTDDELVKLIDGFNAKPWDGADDQDTLFDKLSSGQSCGLTALAGADTNDGLAKKGATVATTTRGGTWGGLFLIGGTTSTKIGALWLGGTKQETAPNKDEKAITDARKHQLWQLRHHAQALKQLTDTQTNHACGNTEDTNLTSTEREQLCGATTLAQKRRAAKQLSARVAQLFTKTTEQEDTAATDRSKQARPQAHTQAREDNSVDEARAPTDNSMQATARPESTRGSATHAAIAITALRHATRAHTRADHAR
ncbi:hypothetical protein, conserved in T. vivax [Trypanosoma vivax Y486]|uniref:Uncharacterized protein n=1 Tax=Trypanosoma vivax (strain Y486) TaxID=1055687 RepID=F9WKM3_TRYVY|nr:hypothetical protein, conserved in T. vivax [Trypanosoma vivax Y486]|eukprot:CCD18045.1 hypothetical protein, conserved in T. vivax [Trypanosoma vivax Y486]